MSIMNRVLGIILSLVISCSIAANENKTQHDMPINAALRTEILTTLINNIKTDYVILDVGARIQKTMNENIANKKYDHITSASEFALQITNDLQSISQDKHLELFYSHETIPITEGELSIAEQLKYHPLATSENNFGFNEVSRLEGNVGYLSFNFFAPPELAQQTAQAAMAFLAHTDALIIDLRKNGGGYPGMISFLASYFFGPEPVHLNDLHWRKDNKVEQLWTLKDIPGDRYLDKKLYLLTSHETFSGAEEFAYDLKVLKRAIIIGETTAGGAHPGENYRINDHFSIFIPTGRAVNPITKTNWEKTGVQPDIAVSQDKALQTAHALALQELLKRNK